MSSFVETKTGFPSSHQLKSYVASKSRLKLAARAVLSADAGLLVFLCLFWKRTFVNYPDVLLATKPTTQSTDLNQRRSSGDFVLFSTIRLVIMKEGR